MSLALEVIATSLDDALAAEDGGAARIELVADLDRGGLTPPLSLVEAVITRLTIPVRVMVRHVEPHEVPDSRQRARLQETAAALAAYSIDGVVFGALTNGTVDEALLADVSDAAGCPITFHRAFEHVVSYDQAIETLLRHPRVDRILADGGPGTWAERSERLASWAARAAPRIGILPGGGITSDALGFLLETPGIREVHVGRVVREPATVDGRVSASLVRGLVGQLTRCD